jgi:hypothetical protein
MSKHIHMPCEILEASKLHKATQNTDSGLPQTLEPQNPVDYHRLFNLFQLFFVYASVWWCPPPPETLMVPICIWIYTKLYNYICMYLYVYASYIQIYVSSIHKCVYIYIHIRNIRMQYVYVYVSPPWKWWGLGGGREHETRNQIRSYNIW